MALQVFGRASAAIGAQNLSLLIVMIALAGFITSQTSDFLLPGNLLNIGLAVTLLGLVSMGQTVVIVAGGLDISVGSIVGLASVTAALAVEATGSVSAGVAGAIVIGALAGAFNGLVITVGKINPVITTLATLSVFQGIGFLVTNGTAVSVSNVAFNNIGSGSIWIVPIPIAILIVTVAFVLIFLRYTDIGRNIYAIGGNPVAARLAGISLDRYKLGIYTLSGLIAGIAAIILTSRTTSGQPASGSVGLELASITAAVLGGCALTGGKGTVVGTFLGVLILGELGNGLILLNVPTFYQLVARGALLLIAVLVQEFRARRPGFFRALFVRMVTR
jgi:ribose transport system permease protein/L-arabinose transport system permease protein